MTCSDCGDSATVMVEMLPGVDGSPWWLCSACWIIGVKPVVRRVVVDSTRLDQSDKQAIGID